MPKVPKIKFQTRPRGNQGYRLARLEMPRTPDLREGFENRLDIYLAYDQKGLGGQGRGYYLTVIGCATDGTFDKHVLYEDPRSYFLVEGAKRFSRKKLETLVDATIDNPPELLTKLVEQAVMHYEKRGKAA